MPEIEALSTSNACSLLSAEAAARLDGAAVVRNARGYFSLAVALDARPLEARDRLEIEVVGRGHVEIVTVPIDEAPLVRAAADEAVRAIGGAGMDLLVAKARRVWQVRERADDPTLALLVAAVLASVLLAPIVPTGGGAIFGVRGARERLSRG